MNFCTLFDSYYIHKGIALYLSLERITDDFHLYVMAFDKDCYNKLQSCGFKHMTVELSDNFETPELLSVKQIRTKPEYYWTCGPSVIYHFLSKNTLPDLTYLDADLFFFSDPHVIQKEIGNSSVAISEQGGEGSNSARYGKYCVQYVYFRNDADGVKCLKWWRERCIEWCYSRYEDGKYGDQKYLEQFEILFNNVHILQHKGILGPWDTNFCNFTENSVIHRGIEYPFVFYHMSGTRFEFNNGELTLNVVESEASPELTRLFYYPYVSLMKDVYINYFGKDITKVKVIGTRKIRALWKKFRKMFRNNPLAIFVYYKILGAKYNGSGESKKV